MLTGLAPKTLAEAAKHVAAIAVLIVNFMGISLLTDSSAAILPTDLVKASTVALQWDGGEACRRRCILTD